MSIERYTVHEADCDGCGAAFDKRRTYDIHYHLIQALNDAGWDADMLSDSVLCPACLKEGKKR